MSDPLTELLTAAHEARVFSGAAWSVGTIQGPARRGILGTRAWGGEPVDDRTLWDLASLTKPIVGLAVMALLEQGRLSLTDPVAEHLPEYADTDKADITIWHLLTHTSGVPGGQPLYRDHPDRASLLEAVRRLPLRARPGVQVEYSSPGFIILGRVAEAASSLPLDELVRRTVTAPAGLSDTLFNPPADQRARAAATEDCPWRGGMIQGTVHDENADVLGGVAAHAGLFTTLDDMEKLALTLLRNGRTTSEGHLLRPHTLAAMTRPATDHLNLRRALAWQGNDPLGAGAGDLLSPAAYGHTGFTGTSLWVDPELGIYQVLLTNRVHPRRGSTAMMRTRPRFHNVAVLDLLGG
ncbi:serine hydrolase domain-containing protein [Actinopolymorpha alba]|uniref:serine hydrolase domain-containing protein n=1 Tax=Actinopolymorpha alba TaxID=533267 RepID=UPI0004772630|nr:serine hydrolase domain-containing protein [Actinopolymorpha alba]